MYKTVGGNRGNIAEGLLSKTIGLLVLVLVIDLWANPFFMVNGSLSWLAAHDSWLNAHGSWLTPHGQEKMARE